MTNSYWSRLWGSSRYNRIETRGSRDNRKVPIYYYLLHITLIVILYDSDIRFYNHPTQSPQCIVLTEYLVNLIFIL